MRLFQKYILLILLICSFESFSRIYAQRYEIVWSDEFDGASLDKNKWSFQYGTGAADGLYRWGNDELQYYTDRAENLSVSDGTLKIIALKESYAGEAYTSSRIRTRYKGDWTYGNFKIRAKLPKGDGIWPAIWMLPSDQAYGGWPKSGEIDIMEAKGREADKVYGTIHYGYNAPNNASNGGVYVKNDSFFTEDFHVYELFWSPNKMRFYVDGVLFYETSTWFSPNGDFPAPFDKRFYMLLNLAVGGKFGGNPSGTSTFPQTLEIDYVRVYQDVNKAPVITADSLGLIKTISAGTTLSLPIQITDGDGEVTSVKWYINEQFYKEDQINETGNYALDWPISMAGCYDIYVVSTDNHNGKDSSLVRSIKTENACEMLPYFGNPISNIDLIKAVHYNKGGHKTAYFDQTPISNSGGKNTFRYEEAVDTRHFNSAEPIVSDFEPGEWLTYSIEIPESGLYDISAFVNRINSRTKLLLFDGAEILGEFIRFPENSSDSTSSKTVSAVYLTSGVHVLKFQVDLAPVEFLAFSIIKYVDTAIEINTEIRSFNVSVWPNPFNPTSKLKVKLSSFSKLEITIYDINGRKMLDLFNGNVQSGEHEFDINAQNWSSGLYIYVVKSNSQTQIGKIVLIK